MFKQEGIRRIFFWSVMLVIGLGMLLRIMMFFQNRSLFIDEACLSSQLIERSYGGLFENMEYQYAPPFFSMAVKGMTDFFCPDEYALRLIPLLASLLGLVFFYRLCRKFVDNRYCLLPVFLFSFGMPMLQYATEVKQYSSDVLVTILLLLLTINWRATELDVKKTIAWALTGGFVVWFSMPGVFILLGVGIYYLFEIYRKQEWNKVAYVLGAILVWLLSFGLYYFTLIRKDIGLDNLEDYHARFFLPLLPTSMAEVHQIKNILLSFFQTSIGATTLAIVFGILTSIWALVHLSKRDFGKVLLLVLPILAAMFASGLKLYSLIPRLTLFFMPILILLIGIGQAQLFERSPKFVKWLLIVPVIIIMAYQKGYPYFYQRFEIEELREVLHYVQENRGAKDAAFLHFEGTHAYVFYSRHYDEADVLKIPNVQIGVWGEDPSAILLPREEGSRIWLIFSHVLEEEVEAYTGYLRSEFVVIDEYRVTGAVGVLMVKKGGERVEKGKKGGKVER